MFKVTGAFVLNFGHWHLKELDIVHMPKSLLIPFCTESYQGWVEHKISVQLLGHGRLNIDDKSSFELMRHRPEMKTHTEGDESIDASGR